MLKGSLKVSDIVVTYTFYHSGESGSWGLDGGAASRFIGSCDPALERVWASQASAAPRALSASLLRLPLHTSFSPTG